MTVRPWAAAAAVTLIGTYILCPLNAMNDECVVRENSAAGC